MNTQDLIENTVIEEISGMKKYAHTSELWFQLEREGYYRAIAILNEVL